MLEPLLIIFEASFATSVNEKQETNMLFKKDRKEFEKKWGNLDFVVHAIAFSDRSELSGEYLNTSRENFLKSMLISCFSLTEIAKEASKIMNKGSSMLTLTYESSKVIPNYNVMGVCKAALETSVKYLARDLGSKGIRVNAISAGPIKTLAASAIGDAKFLYKWNEDHSLLKRNVDINDVGGSAGVIDWERFYGLWMMGWLFKVLVALVDTPIIYFTLWALRDKIQPTSYLEES